MDLIPQGYLVSPPLRNALFATKRPRHPLPSRLNSSCSRIDLLDVRSEVVPYGAKLFG